MIINIRKSRNGWQHHSIINEYNRGCLLWCNEVYYDAICSWNDGLSISKAHLGTQLIIIPLEALELRAGWLDIWIWSHLIIKHTSLLGLFSSLAYVAIHQKIAWWLMKTLIVYLGDYILHKVNIAAATAVGFTLHLTVLRVVVL